MGMRKQSLRQIVRFLNNRDEDGGFWLPNIQRPFVWSEDQICRLFDSILREYPISTLLIWRTRSEIRIRQFIDNYHRNIRLTDFYVPENNQRKLLVLDGQQRLQSLFIGLRGSYEGRELYFDILSGEVAAPDDVKYRFAFLTREEAQFPWLKFKDLVFSNEDMYTASENTILSATRELSPIEKGKIGKHISIVFRTFQGEDGISYQELDSIDNPNLYTEDDVVEIFIRANSGGTRLGKSDLLFSLLAASWDEADRKMEVLLDEVNQNSFEFTRDFVLKTCLTLLDQGAQYEVPKFRKQGVRDEIEQNWDEIAQAIKAVHDFIVEKTYIRDNRAMPSYLVLIPLVYLRYRYPTSWDSAQEMDTYLLRSLLTGAFSGTPDRLIDDCVKKINELQKFELSQIFEVIRSQGRSLELTEDRLWQMGYKSETIHLLFNLWYRDFAYTPAYKGNAPEVDHIFPQSALMKVKEVNPSTGRQAMKYREAERNQLANCMLLKRGENGPSGKTDKLPEVWFADKDPGYLETHLIPRDPVLWKIDRFDDFIAARKELIKEKFGYLLVNK